MISFKHCRALVAALAISLPSLADSKSLHPDTHFIRGYVGEYGEWLIGCDNRANCTMIGTPPYSRIDDVDLRNVDNMIVRIYLAAEQDAAPNVELIPYATGDGTNKRNERPDPFNLMSWDTLGRIAPNHEYARITLDAFEAGMLIEQLRTDGHVYGYNAIDGTTRIRFPGPGFARAYKVTTKRQANLRAEPAESLYAPVKVLPGEELMLPSVAALYRQRPGCHVPSEGVTLRRYRLADNDELWRLQCSDDEAAPSYWYQSGDDGIGKPLYLPDPRDGPIAAGEAGLSEAVFDFDLGVLRSYTRISGRPYCGVFRAWGISRTGWQLLDRREMPVCSGLLLPDWIRTFNAGAAIWRENDE